MNNLQIVVDACVLINLHASDKLYSILRCFNTPLLLPQAILDRELLRSYTGPVLDPRCESAPMDITPYQLDGLLTLGALTEVEQEIYIRLLRLGLGDGEAATFAMAMHRGLVVATDDRRAAKILQQYSPTLQVVQTPDILHLWATNQSVPVSVLKDALVRIKTHGCYHPPKTHPLFSWWSDCSKVQDIINDERTS